MRRKIVAGNWKMNKTFQEAKALLVEILELADSIPKGVELIIAPPAPYLSELQKMTNEHIALSSQTINPNDFGAFTGEFNAMMVSSLGVSYTIVGHSERRSLFGENDEEVALRVKSALDNRMSPIFCCGESREERESGNAFQVVEKQLRASLFDLSKSEYEKVIVAYEPVWAIGTGLTASEDQAQEMHGFIRKTLKDKFNDLADVTPILYGGSCKPGNAAGLFSLGDVDGGLIGGASLNASDFIAIARAHG